jgi:hypothetical protein
MARASSHTKATLSPLLRERDRLIAQWGRLTGQAEALNNKIAGLEIAIGLIEKGDFPEANAEAEDDATPATNVKVLLVELAGEAKADGLNANIAVKLAAKRGIALKRGTAASNLSRLKTDEVLVHDGNRYRLPEFARPKLISSSTSDPKAGWVTMAETAAAATAAWRNKGS